MISMRKFLKTMSVVACGGVLLQAGGCSTLLPSLVDLGISTLLSLLLGSPI